MEELRQQSILHDAGYAGYRACNAPVVAPGPWAVQGAPFLECSWSDPGREEGEADGEGNGDGDSANQVVRYRRFAPQNQVIEDASRPNQDHLLK